MRSNSSQQLLAFVNGRVCEFDLPHQDTLVMRGVLWGRIDVPFTPAFWASQALVSSASATLPSFRLGKTLKEEVAACLLGGHGISAEIGIGAYRAIKTSGLLADGVRPCASEIYTVLSAPMTVRGRNVRYRFARQKSQYLHAAFHRLEEDSPENLEDLELRNWLLELPGIGPKTASWITRNWASSDNVAIIDVHIYRAGLLAGFFTRNDKVDRHYFSMEQRFIQFAQGIGVRASELDAIIWREMKHGRTLATSFLDARERVSKGKVRAVATEETAVA